MQSPNLHKSSKKQIHAVTEIAGPAEKMQAVRPAQELCARCSKLAIPLDPSPWRYDAGTVEDVKQSSHNGCAFCRFICVALDVERQEEELSELGWAESTAVILEKPLNGTILNLLPKPSRFRENNSAYLLLSVEPDSTSENSSKSTKRPEADSEESFRLVTSWLDDCLRNHEACRNSSTGVLPTRVVDVGEKGTNVLKVHIPDVGAIGTYSALSYCWGDGITLKATPAELPTLMNGFALSSLSKTLRDAVRITHELGFRYLWVDSLCILQGPTAEARDDWIRESSLMGSVFANAEVTISAAASTSSQKGIFYPRNIIMPAIKRSGLFRWKSKKLYVNIGIGGFAREYKDEPVHRRAWVLQERLLSQRLLSYCLQDMMWHCNKEMKWERQQPGFIHRIHKERMQGTRNRWNLILFEYSSRSLTNPGDKLPALSAVARKYHESTGDDYLAGLWRSELPGALLWQRSDIGQMYLPVMKPQVASQYRAPSWSWASMDCNIWRIPNYKDFVASILECSVEPSTADAFGMVSGAKLVIETAYVEAMAWQVTDSLSTLPRDQSPSVHLASVWPDEDQLVERPDTDRTAPVVAALVAKSPFYFGLVLRRSRSNPDKWIRGGMFCSSQADQYAMFDAAEKQIFTII